MNRIFLTMLLFSMSVWAGAENIQVAEIAKSLNFLGQWKVEGKEHPVSTLENEDLLLSYNGASDYPQGSGYHVAESKTFARILVSAERGFDLPGGHTYATHSVLDVEAGDVLQRSEPNAHTMVVVSVDDKEVKVVHANWAAYHRVSYNTFTKRWLHENGFKAFKPGVDAVANPKEPTREQYEIPQTDPEGRAFGSWRVVITGEIPYHRISQGTIVSHSGPGGEIWVDENRTVSHTFSTEAGVEAEVISAKVGFSVTHSFSRNLRYRRHVTPGKYGYVDLYYKYMVKKFDVYYDPLFGSEYFVDNGQAYKWQAVEFQYRESDH